MQDKPISLKRLCFTSSLPCKERLDQSVILKVLRVKNVWNQKAEKVFLSKTNTKKLLRKVGKQQLALSLKEESICQIHFICRQNIRKVNYQFFEPMFYLGVPTFGEEETKLLKRELPKLKSLQSFGITGGGNHAIFFCMRYLRNLQELKFGMTLSDFLSYKNFSKDFKTLRLLNLEILEDKTKPSSGKDKRFSQLIESFSQLQSLQQIRLSARNFIFFDGSPILKIIIRTFKSLNLERFCLELSTSNKISQADMSSLFSRIDFLAICDEYKSNSFYSEPQIKSLKAQSSRILFLYFSDKPLFNLVWILDNCASLQTLSIDFTALLKVNPDFRLPKTLKNLCLNRIPERSYYFHSLKLLLAQVESLSSFSAELYFAPNNYEEFQHLVQSPCFKQLKTLSLQIRFERNSKEQMFKYVLGWLAQLEAIESLHLKISSINNFTDCSADFEKCLKRFSNLKCLKIRFLDSARDLNECVSLTIPLENLSKLTELLLEADFSLTCESAVKLLQSIVGKKNFEKLFIEGDLLDEVGSENMLGLAKQIFAIPNLESRIFSGSERYSKDFKGETNVEKITSFELDSEGRDFVYDEF